MHSNAIQKAAEVTAAPAEAVSAEELRLINTYTRRNLSADEVYVTQYGEVYHTDPGCIYLNPQIRAVPASEIGNYRSGNGAMYYPCECCKPGGNGIVYITKEGIRYHSDRNCSGLVRHVSKVETDVAKDSYRPCPICGGKHQGEH